MTHNAWPVVVPPAPTPAPTPAPAPAPMSICWHLQRGSDAGPFLHANAGTSDPVFGYTNPLKARVIGYTSGVVVWNVSWAPIASGIAPDYYSAADVLYVTLPSYGQPHGGLLTVTATVNGVATDSIVLSIAMGGTNYFTMAWGPAP